VVYRRPLPSRGSYRPCPGAFLASVDSLKPDLPEWLRVAAIFVLTFALMIVLTGLAGLKIEWQDDPEYVRQMQDRPY
jgi:hypothetical protein